MLWFGLSYVVAVLEGKEGEIGRGFCLWEKERAGIWVYYTVGCLRPGGWCLVAGGVGFTELVV